MKKEKTVRTYQRRTKSGKMVTVREHKASYDAAEEARKAAAKKAGAGSELSKKKAAVEENPLGFSADDYKEWYHWDMEDDPKNEAALRVEKALTKKMGKKAYNKYLEDMSNSYSARGHKKAHQALLDEYTAQQKKQDAESSKAAKDIARSAKEKATEAKASKVKTKENKSVKAPKKESLEQRDARWNRGEFTDDEKAVAIMVYDMSGPKNNLHPKLSAWAKKEIKRMDDERAAKVDTKILKGLDREVISKLATLQGKKKLSKEDEAFIDKHVAPSGLIRGTKVSAFDALAAYKKDSKTQSSTTPKRTDKPSNKYGGLTKAEYEKRQKDFNKRVKDADKGTRAKYSFTDIKKKIKSADISEAARKRLLKSIEKPYAVVTPTTMEKRLQKELDKKKKPSTKTSGGAPTSADLRKQADEMDARSYKETSRDTHKKLIAKGYKKHTYQGTTYYHKGKEGSYGGSYVMLDKNGKQQTVPAYMKEGMKAQIARSVGKTYKPRTLR